MFAKLARYPESPDISTVQLLDSEIKTRKLGSFCKKCSSPPLIEGGLRDAPSGISGPPATSPGSGEAGFGLGFGPPFFMEISMSAKLPRPPEFPDISTAQLLDSEIKTRQLGPFYKKCSSPPLIEGGLRDVPSGISRPPATSPGSGEAGLGPPFLREISMSAKLPRPPEFPDISTAQLPHAEIKTRNGFDLQKSSLARQVESRGLPNARCSVPNSSVLPGFP